MKYNLSVCLKLKKMSQLMKSLRLACSNIQQVKCQDDLFKKLFPKALVQGILCLVNLRVKEEGQASRFKSSKNDKK